LKSQFHISTDELRSQVVEAEAATATQKLKRSTTPQAITSIIDLINDESEEESEESEEEFFDNDIDELG
jgi:hypothetical protein